MNQYLLSQQGPLAQPWSFVFGVDKDGSPREWPLFPIATVSIAETMEMFVHRYVARNAERRKPDPEDRDEVAWRIYREWSAATRADLDMGFYAAFTVNWQILLSTNEDVISEAIYQSVRHKEPNWTRELHRALQSNPSDYQSVRDAYMDLNFPKALPAAAGNTSSNDQSQSTGNG